MQTTTRRIPKTSLTILFIAIALTAALYAITAHPGAGAPHAAAPRAALAAGTLSIGNSVNGAVLSATGVVPGGPSTQGNVTITNSGSLPGDFTLSKNVTGGGALANLLHVVIVDQTKNQTVYDGSIGGMDARSLGAFAPGESRTYQFTVNFPDGGIPSDNSSGDNAGRGQTATVDYTWTATGNDTTTTGSSTGSGGSATGAGSNGTNGGVSGNANTFALTVAGSSRQNPLKHHNLITVTVLCNSACRLSANGTLSIQGGGAKVYKLSTVSGSLSQAGHMTLKLKVPKKALKQLKKALAKGRAATAKITVTAKAGGSTTRGQRTVILKR